MELIKCKECGHEVSDKASVCPNCGAPLVIDETNKEEVFSEVPQKEKWWKRFFTRKILLLICILIALVGIGSVYFDNPKYFTGYSNSQETWWGDNAFQYFVEPLLFVMLGGLIVALIISIVCYLLSKKHIGRMLVGVVLVGVVTGATICVEEFVYHSRLGKALDKTIYRYSDINNIRETIGGTIWRNSFPSQNESKVEIYFSHDGSSAKFIIDGNESDYEKPTDISNEDIIDNKGNSIQYIIVSFSKGTLALPYNISGYEAKFIPIIMKPKVSYYGNPYASLSSITVGVQDGAYSAAREALKYSVTYVKEYGKGIEMTEYRKDVNGVECTVLNDGVLEKMSDVNYFHSDNSAIDEVKNRQENQQDSATPAGLTFRTFTKNDKESGNTIQSRLSNETIVSNLKKLGFDLIDRTTESRPDYTGEDYYEVTVETYSKAVNGNVTTVKLESEYTAFYVTNQGKSSF